MSATSEQAINYLRKYMTDMQRLEMEKANSKLRGKDTDYLEGYKCAANKAIEWFNKKMYCLKIDGDSTLGEQFKNEMLEGL